MYSSSIHQLWLLHLIMRSLKATRMLDNSEVHSLFLFLFTKSYTLFMNIILCGWHVTWHLLTDMVDMMTNIVYYFKWGLVNMLTWQSCNMLTWGCFYTSVNFSSWVPTPGNLPSKAKKMLMPGGKPGGWGGRGRVAGWAQLELTNALVHKIQEIYGYALFVWWIT